MRTLLIGLVSAGLATATIAGQSSPTPPTPQTPTTQTQPRTAGADRKDAGQPVTVQGCLMREADVPGLAPNVAERAGVTEDFVLTSARVIKGSDTASPSGRSTGSSAAMFEVEGLSKDKLESHVNRRVEIDGTIDDSDQDARGDTTRAPVPPTPDPTMPAPTSNPKGMKAPATSAGDLVGLQAKTIRAVPGDCPTAR
jgi:hypothetical protein